MAVRFIYTSPWLSTEVFWERMKRRHLAMWKFIEAFIKLNDTGKMRVIEVGGAAGDVSRWIKGRYVCIDRSPKMVALGQTRYPDARFILDDFTKMDTRQFQPQNYGLVLAAGVIEHCPGYEVFIQRALDTDAPVIVITFFRGLLWRENRIQKVVSPDAVFYENRYSGIQLTEFLDEMGLKYRLFTIAHNGKPKFSDVVLVIDSRQDQPDAWWDAIDALGLTVHGYCDEMRDEWEQAVVLKDRQRAARERKALLQSKKIATEVLLKTSNESTLDPFQPS